MTTNSSLVPSGGDRIAEFVSLIQGGIALWAKAATIAREEVAKDPSWPERACEETPGLRIEFVNRFTGIGVKYLAELCVMECPGAKKLRKLPLHVQERYIRELVPVMFEGRNGWEELHIDLQNLTKAQAEQVFDKERVRSTAEQRAWLLDQREQKRQAQSLTALALANTGLPYRVTRTHFLFGDPEHALTWKQVARLLKDAKTLKA